MCEYDQIFDLCVNWIFENERCDHVDETEVGCFCVLNIKFVEEYNCFKHHLYKGFYLSYCLDEQPLQKFLEEFGSIMRRFKALGTEYDCVLFLFQVFLEVSGENIYQLTQGMRCDLEMFL